LYTEYCNDVLLAYSGLRPDQVIGRPWEETRNLLLHPDDLPKTLVKTEHSSVYGTEYVNESRVRRHDGQYRTFLTRAVPLVDDSGKLLRWIGSSTDIHDQKQAEEALRRSEKLATAGRLAASIAHEINNPLAAVTNALYLASHDPSLFEPRRKYLAVAERELARVAHVTTQTLRFHQQSTAPKQTDLRELMDSTLALFAGRLKKAALRLDQEFRFQELFLCYGDDLRQVFANLLSHAIDATNRGGTIRMRVRRSRSYSSRKRADEKLPASTCSGRSGAPWD